MEDGGEGDRKKIERPQSEKNIAPPQTALPPTTAEESKLDLGVVGDYGSSPRTKKKNDYSIQRVPLTADDALENNLQTNANMLVQDGI